MRFNYQARTEDGEVKTGVVEALNKDSVFRILKERGLYVTYVEEIKSSFYNKEIKIFQKIKKKDIAVFSRQIAIMFKSKVPLIEIFQTVAKQTTNASFREKISKMTKEIEGGASLSDVFSAYPKIFSSFYISMIKSGETSGKLVDSFLYLADYLEKEENFRRKIIGAIIYPCFILFVFASVIAITVIFIIPQLTVLLEETDQELPILTRIVIWVSDFSKSKGWVLLIFLIAFIFSFIKWVKTKNGKRIFDKFILKVPIINDFLKKIYLARIALNLSTLVSGGLPISICLQVTADIVGNSVYKDILLKAKESVKQGEPISFTFERYPKEVSPFFYQMIIIGEKTGTLESSLKNVIFFYEEETERDIANIIKMIEPVLIIFLGLIIGGLIAAILIPIYSISLG